MVVPYFEFTVMNNEKMLLAKAWDNRIGCAIAIDVLKALKDVASKRGLWYWCGSRRSWSSWFENIYLKIQPDIGFAVDVGIAGDTPGVSDKEAIVRWVKARKSYFMMLRWYPIKDYAIL